MQAIEEWKNVYLTKLYGNPHKITYFGVKKIKGVTYRTGYYKESRKAALTLDKVLVNAGFEPINILKRV